MTSYIRTLAGVAVTSIALLPLAGVYMELQDPFVGRAIRLEAGDAYVTQFYFALALAVVLHATGVYLGIRRRHAA